MKVEQVIKSRNMSRREIILSQIIQLLEGQIVDLILMSKIELGDDVIDEIKRLKEQLKIEGYES